MNQEKENKDLAIIGSTALVSIAGHAYNIPAKIDTGADSSSIWASDINITKDGILRFRLFGNGSPFYTGEIIERSDYKVLVIRSSTGEEQVCYRTHFIIEIEGRRIRALLNLSNRSRNNAPILIGERTIRGKFMVDVSRVAVELPKNPRTTRLNAELRKNSYEFHKKYHKKGVEQ